jgi:hypothetical protein
MSTVAQLVGLTKLDDLKKFSQKPTIGKYPKPVEFILHPYISIMKEN